MEKSLYYFKQTEFLEKKYNKQHLLTKLYSNMCNLYADWHKTDLAIKYYEQAIDIGLKYNNKKSVGITYNNLDNTYIQRGDLVAAINFFIKRFSNTRRNKR